MPRVLHRKTAIRPATREDLAGVVSWLGQGMARRPQFHAGQPTIFPHHEGRAKRIVRERIADGCLLLAEQDDFPCALAGIDLERAEIRELLVSGDRRDAELPAALLVELERLAVRFGLDRLQVTAPRGSKGFFAAHGYLQIAGSDAGGCSPLQHSLRRRQTAYGRRVQAIGAGLGIPADYGRKHRLALQEEARRLVSIGLDAFDREQFLVPRAARAWRSMQAAAQAQGLALRVVSAYRSVDYQAGLLRRKLQQGLEMRDILRVSAAPGFSEHHTGRALDLTTPGYEALQETFEESAAFGWLRRRATEFGFRLSFPRDNRHRLAYEPWHWFFEG